ncbi:MULTISPECIES: carbon storage regulator [unclassified Schlesneria]|uniref:carbon storage regulator n=1 Tax=Schlesneria TaxID=656899 RepID=UPI002F0B6851
MLVISRKVGEKIVIPGLNAEIEIVAIQGSKIRLGISAPSDVNIQRQDLSLALEGSNRIGN